MNPEDRTSGRIVTIAPEQLRSDTNVNVWYSGLVLLSCPGQVAADRVKVE